MIRGGGAVMKGKKVFVFFLVAGLLLTPVLVSRAKTTQTAQVTTKVEKTTKENVNSLPTIVFLKVHWDKNTDADAGGYRLSIWVLGFGRHIIKVKRWNDFDGDGQWDLRDGTPNVFEIRPGLIPIHYFDNLETSWSGYDGKCHINIRIWVDGTKVKDKDFYEPGP